MSWDREMVERMAQAILTERYRYSDFNGLTLDRLTPHFRAKFLSAAKAALDAMQVTP